MPSEPERPPRRLTILAPAKINLGLEVLRRRPDGYHEIATLMQAIRLTDRIDLELLPEETIELLVRPRDLDLGPREANLAVRAAGLVPPTARRWPGVRITLHKRIPVGAGLGGGSADAAAVLLGLGILRRRGIPLERLEELGATLGSDVPFFFRGGTQLATGRGERLRQAPIWPGRHLVISHAGKPLSTAWVYARVKTGLTPPGPISSICLRGDSQGFWSRYASALRNDLEPVAAAAEPAIPLLLAKFAELGSTFARVTGSGSAVFATAPDGASAESWVRHLEGLGHWAKHVRPARGGCICRRS
jgi:4-diphosphocytidyl-2-C-methyl-D-erythritol kinase